MEKNQYKLCLEVFRRLHAKGLLDGLVLIGSWCLLFYRDYFGARNYRAAIRTRASTGPVPVARETLHRTLNRTLNRLTHRAKLAGP